MKTKFKHLLLQWSKVLRTMLWGWFVYTPVYLFYAGAFYLAFHLSELAPTLTFWQCLGLVILIRQIKNVWRWAGDVHQEKPIQIHKEPFQLPPPVLKNGLCVYGDKLLLKTQSGQFYETETGELFQEDGKQFSPTVRGLN